MPAKSEKQRRFMAMCLYNKNKAQSNCPPKDVADKFVHGHENTINARHALKTLFESTTLFESWLRKILMGRLRNKARKTYKPYAVRNREWEEDWSFPVTPKPTDIGSPKPEPSPAPSPKPEPSPEPRSEPESGRDLGYDRTIVPRQLNWMDRIINAKRNADATTNRFASMQHHKATTKAPSPEQVAEFETQLQQRSKAKRDAELEAKKAQEEAEQNRQAQAERQAQEKERRNAGQGQAW